MPEYTKLGYEHVGFQRLCTRYVIMICTPIVYSLLVANSAIVNKLYMASWFCLSLKYINVSFDATSKH